MLGTMRSTVGILLMAGVVAAGSLADDQQVPAPTPNPALLVLAKKDTALAIVDPATDQVVAKVAVGINPHEVIASDDGQTAWVTNYDNGSAHTITVVDLATRRVLKVIELGPLWGPHGLAVSGGKTYFTAERAKVIGRIDPTIETVDWIRGTGQIGTHMLWVSRDGKKIITVNVGSGTMTFLTERSATDPSSMPPQKLSKQGGIATLGLKGAPAPDWDEEVVKVGTYPEGFDVIPDKNGDPETIWVANAGEGTVSIIDWKSRAVTATLDLGLKTANRLRFTPNHRLALISREKSGDLAVVDVASRHMEKQIPVGTGGAGVLVTPDGRRAYVSCSPDDWVAVIDLKTMAVIGRIHPGTEPDGLAWAVRR